MIDSQTQDLELAIEVGFRIVKTGEDTYQFQRIDGRGRATAVSPAQKHAHDLWLLFVTTARRLGEVVEGAEPDKSTPQVA
jgi:hypothetical protein